MQNGRRRSVSGHVYRRTRQKGPAWYWKVRLPDGSEERRLIGPEWNGPGRPPAGHFTKRTAQAALEERLVDLRRGIGARVRTGATFEDAAQAWLHWGETEGAWKPATLRDYRSAVRKHLLPAFGSMRLEAIDARAIEEWRTRVLGAGSQRRTAAKLIAMLHSIFKRARKLYGLSVDPVADVEPLRLRYDVGDFRFYTPEEVLALARETAQPAKPEHSDVASPQDAAIFLTAAFTGLRLGELLALRVRDVDFEAEAIRVMGSVDILAGVGTPKSGRGRTVPMVPEVAQVLARILQREHFTGADDFVFAGETGRYLDGSALRRRYKAAQKRAGLPEIRFHDLRHTFGSLAIRELGTLEVQHLMGHADSRTTARYTHYKSRSDEAKKLAAAFRISGPTSGEPTEAAP
jgi:integrase